jgi:hypothetical protein
MDEPILGTRQVSTRLSAPKAADLVCLGLQLKNMRFELIIILYTSLLLEVCTFVFVEVIQILVQFVPLVIRKNRFLAR